MKGCRVFDDLPFKSYKHHKNRENTFFSRFLAIFVMLITFEEKVVENAATLHFAQIFVLFKMVLLKTNYCKAFWDLKNTVLRFLETLLP
jgi:hypothetical protein